MCNTQFAEQPDRKHYGWIEDIADKLGGYWSNAENRDRYYADSLQWKLQFDRANNIASDD